MGATRISEVFINFPEIPTPPNPATDVGRLYCKDLVGITTLFFRDDVGTETNLLAAGSGEANTSSNVGTGEGLALAKVGVDLPFKSLIGEASKIVLTGNANDIVFALGANVVTTDQSNQVINAMIVAHTSTKITITAKGQLNSAIVYTDQTNTFIAGNLNTFAHDATNPGLAVLPVAGDPTARADGAIWLNVTSQQLFARINGADVDLGAGAGGGEANTLASLGGGTVLTAAVPKSGVQLQTVSIATTAPLTHSVTTDLLTFDINDLVNADISATAAILHNKLAALTINRALITDGSGFIVVSTVTNTELALLSGATTLELQANKGAVSGYAGLDATQKLLLTNFPSGTGLQVLRRNTGNTALEFATLAGGGDMVLADAQTNTGIKTFLDTTMKLRNVANTFDAFFVNTVTAERIITIPDAAGTMIITGLANQITNTELTSGVFGKITGLGTQTQALDLAAQGITVTSRATGDILKDNGTNLQRFARGAADTVLKVNTAGTDLEYDLISDANIAATAEIAVSKLQDGTPGQFIRTDSAGTGVEWTDDIFTISFIIDGGGSVITTGKKGTVTVDFDCEVIEWAVIATGASGAIIVDVNRSTFAGFPTTTSIAAANLPTITATSDKGEDRTLSGWSAINAGDVIEFEVDSITAITLASVNLVCRKTG